MQFTWSHSWTSRKGAKNFGKEKKQSKEKVTTNLLGSMSNPWDMDFVIQNFAEIVFKEAKRRCPSNRSLTFTHPISMDFHGRKTSFNPLGTFIYCYLMSNMCNLQLNESFTMIFNKIRT